MSHLRKDWLKTAVIWAVPLALMSAGLSLFVLSAFITAPPVFIVVLCAVLSSV